MAWCGDSVMQMAQDGEGGETSLLFSGCFLVKGCHHVTCLFACRISPMAYEEGTVHCKEP